jgi:hypothetical protein
MLARMRRGDSMKRRDVFAIAGGAVALSVGATGAQAGTRAHPIKTAPTQPERTLLLYCPEQGGWHTGKWFDERWLDSVTMSEDLEATHWMEVPPEPESG